MNVIHLKHERRFILSAHVEKHYRGSLFLVWSDFYDLSLDTFYAKRMCDFIPYAIFLPRYLQAIPSTS